MRVKKEHRLASHVGKVRTRLAALLVTEFKKQQNMELVLTGDDLRPALGRNRSDYRQDVYRWEGYGKLKHPTTGRLMTATFDSWDTMTACVRGVSIELDGGWGQYSVSATRP